MAGPGGEPLEQPVAQLGRDAGTGVAHRELGLVADMRVDTWIGLRAVGDGVGHEVVDDLGQPVGVDHGAHAVAELALDHGVRMGDAEPLERGLQHLGQVALHEVQVEGGCLQAATS